jgi:exopolysaccharide biosynthesis polyprenyl glycosylphosphotransferase
LDALFVVVVFNLVLFLRGVSAGPLLSPVIAPAFIFMLSIHLIDGYGARSDMLSLDYASLHFIALFFAALTTLLLTYAFLPAGFELQSSRSAILVSFAILAPVSLAYRRLLQTRSEISQIDHSLVFVGETVDYDIFKDECVRMGNARPLIHVGSADNYKGFGEIIEAISQSKIHVEAIVVKESSRTLPDSIPLKLVQLYFAGIPTYTLEIFHQVYWRKIPLYRINPIWLLQEGFQVARDPVFERMKRVSDVILSVLGLIVTAPIIGITAIAIKANDGGPVFFSQTRIGLHGVPFLLLKLRTMRVSKGVTDPYTRPGDARVTRVGRILRAMRLDELPQLWNVFLGQMSLIGPRAEWDRLVSEYEKEIPSYHFRHLVKPGITGWAQVNYRYGSGVQDTLRKLEYDLYYIRNFSFMLDASIVLKTIHVMLLQKGR